MTRTRTPLGRWWLYAILTVALVAVVSPFAWMILGSFKSEGELRQSPPTWWPHTASLDNYAHLFADPHFAARRQSNSRRSQIGNGLCPREGSDGLVMAADLSAPAGEIHVAPAKLAAHIERRQAD